MNYSAVDVSKVVAIEIQPLAPDNGQPSFGQQPTYSTRMDAFETKFEFRNLKVHTGTPFDYKGPDVEPVSVVANVRASVRNLSLAGITKNALKLNITQSGLYNVKIFSANGRLLQSFDSANLSAGLNTLKLNNFASGVYMIKVQGINTKQQLTKSALIM
jgi:hypothetical protein